MATGGPGRYADDQVWLAYGGWPGIDTADGQVLLQGDPGDTLMTRYDCRGSGRYADDQVRLQGDPGDTLMTRYDYRGTRTIR